MKLKTFFPIAAVVAGLSLFGCGGGHDHGAHGHGHGHDHGDGGHAHEHVAPHGGTAVVLGDEVFHLEFVHVPEEGLMDAFVLDGHMEEFVRIKAESFTVAATIGEKTEKLVFAAKGNDATGEKVGDTSQFTVQADWLKTATNFNAVVELIDVSGTSFTNVNFKFPEGNE